MSRACTLLAATIALWATAVCHGGEILKGMALAQPKQATSQPAPTVLPPPTALPAEPEPATLPPPPPLTAEPQPPAASPCCKGACATRCHSCAEQCDRLIEWLTYRPLTRCGPCGCLLCVSPCCHPPLYTYFLADCVEGGPCGHGVSAHLVPAAGCQTCASEQQITKSPSAVVKKSSTSSQTSASKQQAATDCKTSAKKHEVTGLLPMMKSCLQCGYSPSTPEPANPR
jgi:hypothetical protein